MFGSFRFWYLFFNIGLSSIHVYNEITQNFEVFLVATSAVASTWGCYRSLSSLRWHPLLKFKPWHHFPPLKLRPQTRCRLTNRLWKLKSQYNSSIPQRYHQQQVLSLQKTKSSSSRCSKWQRPLRLNPKQTTWFTFSKTPKFSFSDCKWLQVSQTTHSSIVEHGGWIEGFAPISSQIFFYLLSFTFQTMCVDIYGLIGREIRENGMQMKEFINPFLIFLN